MATKFETFDVPRNDAEPEISAEEKAKLVKRLAKIDADLCKKIKKIARTEAEAWKKSRHRG